MSIMPTAATRSSIWAKCAVCGNDDVETTGPLKIGSEVECTTCGATLTLVHTDHADDGNTYEWEAAFV